VKKKKPNITLLHQKDSAQVVEIQKPCAKFVYRNPDYVYLSSLKDVNVEERKDNETLIYNQEEQIWNTGPRTNVTIEVDYPPIDAGAY